MQKNRSLGKIALFFAGAILGGATFLFALQVPDRPDDYVTDRAGLLSSAVHHRLNQDLKTFEDGSSTQIAVAIFPSLEGQSLEDFSIRLAERWKVGQKKKNNGVIFLIFKNDRKMRIEVGYGLESVLTDAKCSRILNEIVRPEFRRGNFDQGVISGVGAIMQVTQGNFPFKQKDPYEKREEDRTVSLIFYLFFMGIVLGLLDYLGKNGRGTFGSYYRGGYSSGGWGSSGGSSGSFGGGGFRGGGGSFGGGGASGGW